jgi:tRNA nucleotidyltransferase/poly(A) polymerase
MNLSESYKNRLQELAGTKILAESSIVVDELNALPFKKDVESIGGKIYSVGGRVRDEILGKQSKDLDILITGVPLDRLEHILIKYGKVSPVGKSFGIIKFVPTGETEEIDIAIPRTEKKTGAGYTGFEVTSDHTLPIEADLKRRDITINSIAKDAEGNVIDPFGGLDDLKNKVIRATNEKAFEEDPLRLLRSIQFSARFGFSIEPKTMSMIKNNAHRIKEISGERILIELEKILKKGNIKTGVDILINTGLFKEIFGFTYVGDNDFSKIKIMADFIYKMFENRGHSAASFYKGRLEGSNDVTNQIKALELQDNLLGNKLEDRKIVQKILSMSPNIEESGLLKDGTKVIIKSFKDGIYPLKTTDLQINGEDLKTMGFQKEGIGKNLALIMKAILSDEIPNKKEDIIKFVEEINKPIELDKNDDINTSDSPDSINVIKEVRKIVRNILEESHNKQTLKKILDSDEAYKILDSSPASGTMWTQGGCAILAFALNKAFGYPVYAIYDKDLKQADHFVVKTPNNTYLDYRGESKNIVKKFKDDEMLWDKNLVLVPYNSSMNVSDIVIDEKASSKLADLIKNDSLTTNKNIDESVKPDDYKSWKRKNVTLRGVSNGPGEHNGVGSITLGDGLYTASLGNKDMAKKYGSVYFVLNARPKNPLVFNNTNESEIWLQQNIYFKKYKNMIEFNKHTTIEDEIQKLGYDGIEIKGREMVNYKPENVKYFKTENELIDYYEKNIKQ